MRSWLFVPGDSPRKLDKGLVCGADVVIIDLEDSVAVSAKENARQITAERLWSRPEGARRIYVRVNSFDSGLTQADIDAIMPTRPDGIVLPKAEGAPSITRLAAMLAVAEAENGLPDGSTRIMAIASETARAIFTLGDYHRSSQRLDALAWGAEDLSADIGAETNRDAAGLFTEPFRLARNLCLFGAAAAEVSAIDTVYVDFRNPEGLRSEATEARRDGFTGKMAIHPDQVAIINEVFTPSAATIEDAEAIIAAFEAQPGAGVVAIGGKMFDVPHLKRARRILQRAAQAAG